MVNKNDPKIIFWGTAEFAAEILAGVLKEYPITAIVTQPDKPTGRHQTIESPAVKKLAQELEISVLQPEKLKNNQEFIDRLKELKPDLFIVAAYGQKIPKEVLTIPKYGSLNVHPSLLPKYRGSSPVQAAIYNGDEETGVTIMLVDEEMDHGPILGSMKYELGSRKFTTEELKKELARSGVKLLLETLPKWLAGEIKPREQEHDKATFTKILTREDGRIDWSRSAEEIDRQIRAYTPWPGCYTEIDGKRLKIIKAHILNPAVGCAENAKDGQIFKVAEGELAINCGQGSIILDIVQLAGKKEVGGKDFLNGHPEMVGKVLK